MLLAEFLQREGIYDGDSRRDLDLNVVKQFTFGDRYLIECKSGAKYDVPDLDVMLAIVHDEYRLWRKQMIPMVEIWPSPGVKVREQVLSITSATPNGFVPPPPLDAVLHKVKHAVTMYTLTGKWDQFNNVKGNL